MTIGPVHSYIDHTLLTPEATPEQITQLCDEAIAHRFAAVCVHGIYLEQVAGIIAASIDHKPALAAVADFPLGASTPKQKAQQAASLVRIGATEIDAVSHLPRLLAADRQAIVENLKPLIDSALEANPDTLIKVIVETAALMHDCPPDLAERRIATACEAVHDAGAHFIKTSTGFHKQGGATLQAVQLLHKHASPLGLKVKAAGGIRTQQDALDFIAAGAERLGTSSGIKLIAGIEPTASY